MRTASCGLLTYAKRRFDYFRDRTFRWPSLLSAPASIFYSFASILATPWIEYRLRKTLRLKSDPAVPKKNQIISVGRWDSYQKNLSLLLKTLRKFLNQNPDWTSLVIGSGFPAKSPHPRIAFLTFLSPTDLARYMQESKIFLSTSRYESFGLASAEASACGCAVVDPSKVLILGDASFSANPTSFGKLSFSPKGICNQILGLLC